MYVLWCEIECIGCDLGYYGVGVGVDVLCV